MESISKATAGTSSNIRLHVPKSRFHVRKIYDRFYQEVVSRVETGNSEVAIKLIRSRTGEVNNADEVGVTLLMSACIHGDPLVVRALIEEGASVNATDNAIFALNMIEKASRPQSSGSKAALGSLRALATDSVTNMTSITSYINKDLWTPLMYACRDGQVEIVTQLLDSEADPEKRDLGGWTALMWACYKGRAECVDEMIRRGANVNIKAMHNMTCLHWAAGRGHVEVINLLLANGAKVDATDKYGSTPLIWACRKGYIAIVTSLLELGASVDAVGMYSWTPLLLALQGGHVDVAKAILQHYPNLNATDKLGMTALALAAKTGYDDIVTELIEQGAYLNVIDKNGDTVLHHAVRGCHIDIVKVLLRKNPDIDASGQDGKTVLNLAIEKGNSALVKTLLSADPDKELSDKDGNTPLLRAVRNRNCEMAAMLVEKGARVAAADSKGDTSLHVAMRARNRRMVELLLKNPKHSRYLYIRNHCGETPYNIDGGHKKSLLSHIFGARALNSQNAVESQLGYELYSSALADILSSPTLNTPMSVGLFAKWGSGKSFLLKKLKEDMKAYMRQSPRIYFEFSWLVFIVNFTISVLLGLLFAGIIKWMVGLIVGGAIFFLMYIMQGVLYCLYSKKNWDWINHISHSIAKKLQRLRLLMYMFFYNRRPPLTNELSCTSISFVFAESTKLTSLGGEQSLSSMIGSLFDALEKKYGTCVTRLYKVFGSEKEHKGKFKRICCVPYFVILIFVLACLVSGVGLLWTYPHIRNNPKEANIVMIVLAGIVALSILLSLRNVGRAIAAYALSPKRCTMNASQSLDASKSDKFLHVLKEEVEFISSLVTTMDRHEGWQTRLVLIIDGLDSCEQEKVLQVLDAINLIIPENSPFIILLALDPHIIIKGIEANQIQGMQDQGLNGYGYLRNMVHLPFYLQNHGLPRMYNANEDGERKKWPSTKVQGKQKSLSERRPSNMSSSLSLDHNRASYKRYGSSAADSYVTLEPLQQVIGEMPKNVIKNDYFVDINPRSMRRLMNIIAMAGRLLRANDIDFDWYRLSAWINITEQWPYRTSWILLYYEEMEGRLDNNLSLLSIYELVKERIPVLREAEPLLDIDRNEKKFIAFLKSHVPKLDVDDIKKFMPSTINLDPFLRKIIKEKSRDQELAQYHPDKGMPVPTTPNGVYLPPRFPGNQVWQHSAYNNQLTNPWVERQQHYLMPQTAARQAKVPKAAKPLSQSNVSDICDLLYKIKGLSSLNIDTYKAAILLHNISGLVLIQCDLTELKSILEMKFGDWQLFQSTILAMREADNSTPLSSTSSSNSDVSGAKAVSVAAVDIPVDQQRDITDLNNGSNTSNNSTASRRKSSSLKLPTNKISRVDTSEDTVRLENQMIMNAVHTLVPDAASEGDEDSSCSEDEQQSTLQLNGNNHETPAESIALRTVCFSIVDECTDDTEGLLQNASDLLSGTSQFSIEAVPEQPTKATGPRSIAENQHAEAETLSRRHSINSLPVIHEGATPPPHILKTRSLTRGAVNLAFTP